MGRCVNIKFFLLISAFLLISHSMHSTSYADITPVSDRTSQVRDAIVAAVPGIDAAADVTETHLTTITRLNLRAKSITALKSGDFSGLTGLTDLNLYGNQLSSLPNGVFEGLTALTTLRLGGNTVDPLPISVSLEKTDGGQFKAVAPIGAPYDIVLPISATNGSIADSVTSLTISKGSTESSAITVSRTADTTAAVTANIGTLPSLPQNHYGYTLSKSSALPVEIISEVVTTTPVVPEPIVPDPVVPDPIEPEPSTNTAPVFTDGVNTIRTIAENTAANINISSAVTATDADDNTLTYSLSSTDASSFSIDSTSGQLSTKTTLDYETKSVYIVTVTVSDGNLTDTITVVISIIDVAETTFVSTTLAVSNRTAQVQNAIVAAIPGVSLANEVTDTHLATITALDLRGAGISELKSGDFSGLTALTNLNLYNNMLSSLPSGIFDGLTALTTLRLGGNLVDPMPLIVSLQQVADNQFQAVIPVGAPFDVVVPVGAMMITIPQGSVESDTFTADASVTLGALPSLPANHFGYILAKSAVCNRTSQVADAIAAAVPGVSNCHNVTEVDLATITSLNLSSMSITSLKTGDFAGMLSLTTLNLSGNQLTSLPDGIFADLASLVEVNLNGNSVSPLPLTISLQKVGSNQIKAVIPTSAPFDIVLPLAVANGSLSGGTALTIPTGSVESSTQTITRTSGTTAAVTVDISSLPNLPPLHSGYGLVKSNQQPLEIFKRINVAPIFTEGTTATRTIAENTTADTNIGTATAATDANNDTLIYSLSGTDAASFSIVSTSGQLKTKATLDYETKTSYSVTITVSDGNLTDTISVTINITDVNETPSNNAPVFTDGTTATRTIAENTGIGVNIGTAVSATDADDDTLTYTLSGTDAASFSIDSSSGQLQTSVALDYETKSSYSVTITVSDGKGGSDSISVTINVTDIDETPATDNTVTTKDDNTPNNAPMFTDGDSTTRTVAENTSSGVDIGSAVSAADEDKDDTLTYSLGGTDENSFGIDSTSGQLRTSAVLDYEIKNSYSVTITVSDGKGGSDSISVTINITDVDESAPNNVPTFTDGDSTTHTVAENTASGVDIGSAITATDADNDTLTYSLSGTNESSFEIVSSSGQLKTKDALNHETKSSYSVTISVSDGEGGSDSISVTINVTNVNEVPVFSDGTTTTRAIAENIGENINIGTAVKATDPDTDDSLTYTLGGTNAASFAIDDKTGQLKTKAALDFETKSSYSVTITVKDAGNLTDSISVTINVTNLDETPSNIAPIFDDGDSTTRSIAENTPADRNIGAAVSATDTDSNTLAYVIGGDDASSFSIDLNTGQLKTSAALDHETKSSYTVTVEVSDGSLKDTIDVTISVTDVNEAPVFADDSITLSVAENTAANTDIGSAITATDPDEDILEYTLGGTDVTSFGINSETGQLKTEATLDYETETSYSVTITASDGNLSDTISVTINVTDVDENRAPAFASASTTRSVAENIGPGVNIGDAVSATDADDDDTLTYTLGGTAAASFSIDSTTGQLRTKAALDYENKSSYSVTITASDGKKNDSITVTITITDVDENRAPAFASESTTRSVAENTGSGVNIGSAVSATDADDDTLEYTLGGTDAASFDIDDTNGQLKTKTSLDYETKTSYSVTITASDGKKNDSITVTITVTDVNENRPPAFSGISFSYSILDIANASVGDDIGSPVTATDADNDTLSYSVGGDDASYFSIDSGTGQLKVTQSLIDDSSSSYSIKVIATDPSDTTAEISGTINVTRLVTQQQNTNNAPVFDEGSTTTRSVDKGTYPSQDLGAPVSATDANDDTLTYTLSGTDVALFEIDSTNGQLSNKDFLKYEDKTSYSVTVTANDNNGGTNTITVTITDDKSPVIVIRTFIRQNEPNWVLELDSETGVVRAVKPADDRPNNSDLNVVSFTRPPSVQFENSFTVAIDFDEEVSGLEQTDLTLTENTAGANVTSWEVLMGWSGNNTVTKYSAKVEVTQSGKVTFSVDAGVASDGAGNSNAAAESKTVTVTIELTDYPPWDVNEDGSVDATDSALVTAALGQTGDGIVNTRTDVNWDGTVDADDVTLVTYHIADEDAEAPSIIGKFPLLDKKTLEKLDPVTLQNN